MESISDRIVRLFKENKITEKGLKKAFDDGLIPESVYVDLTGGYYARNSTMKPSAVEGEE